MDWRAIRRRRRRLLAVAAVVAAVVVAVVVGVVLAVGLLFGHGWREEVVLRALASPDESKASWAKRQLAPASDKGTGVLLEHLGKRGELFDLRVADYLEELGRADRLPTELRVRAALAHLPDPLLASVGVARLMELPAAALPELLRQSQGLEGPELHRAALAACQLDKEGSAAAARPLLEDPSPGARRLGAAILGALGEGSSAEVVIPLLRDPDPSVRMEAVADLVALRKAGALPQLAPLLEDPEETVREGVLQAFAQVGSREHGGLVAFALADVDAAVRAQAVLTLAELQAEEHAEKLAELGDDSAPVVRQAVAAALSALRPPRDRELLEKLCRDQAGEVRQATVQALAKRSDEVWALSELFRLAEDDELKIVREAYRALVESRRPAVIPFFIGQLTNEQPSWATDPLPVQVAGARPLPVPLGAMAACALHWMTGKEFGYHWRASPEERRVAQERWQNWLAQESANYDLAKVEPPTGFGSYEQLLGGMTRPR